MTTAVFKAALVNWMLKHDCTIDRIDPPSEENGTGWFCVFEMPNKVGSRFKNFGSGETETKALINAMKRAGVYGIECHLFVLEFVIEHLANRVLPAVEKRSARG